MKCNDACNRVLTVGLDNESKKFISSKLSTVKFLHICNNEGFKTLLNERPDSYASLIFCGPDLCGNCPLVMLQEIHNAFPESRIIFILGNTSGLQKTALKKNGVSKAFVLPDDKIMLNLELDQFVKLLSDSPEQTRFQAIHLFDIEPGDILPFDLSVLLPMNKKYIKVVNSGDKIRSQQIHTFKVKQVGKVFIDSKQKHKFYDYCADKLVDLTDPNSVMSETERKQKLQSSVRDLFFAIYNGSDTVDSETGRQIMKQCESVVAKFLEKKTGISFHKQIEVALGSAEDLYTHASSVSAIACLLSMATDIGKPEDLALAGLFHDVALQSFKHDPYPGNDFLESLNADDKKKYLEHPIDAHRVLRMKKVTLSPEIFTIIEQHHERADGNGFPKALSSVRIVLEAQLLSLADQLDYYGQYRLGERRLNLLQTIDKIEKNGSINLELLLKVRKILNGENSI